MKLDPAMHSARAPRPNESQGRVIFLKKCSKQSRIPQDDVFELACETIASYGLGFRSAVKVVSI